VLNNERILLVPISKDDTNFVLSLRNNLTVAKNFFSDPPMYDYEHNSWLNSRDNNDLDFIIYENEKKVRIGRISIRNIDFKNQKGEYGIVLNPDFTGKGFAYDASVILINYVFDNLPINKLYLEVFESNLKAIKLYEKLGFEKEGLFIEEYFKCGNFQNTYRMGLLRGKWFEK
jgi:diamine N-acetyltransferase